MMTYTIAWILSMIAAFTLGLVVAQWRTNKELTLLRHKLMEHRLGVWK